MKEFSSVVDVDRLSTPLGLTDQGGLPYNPACNNRMQKKKVFHFTVFRSSIKYDETVDRTSRNIFF